MSFIFVVPLKSMSSSADWACAQRLCLETIRSMLAGGPEVRVILVCNEVPEGLPQDQRLTVVSIATPQPRTSRQKLEDKYAKLRHGLAMARRFAPCWLMRADADDLVSARLVTFALSAHPAKHCVVETGWVWKQKSRGLVKQRDFHRVCGTSLASYIEPEDFQDLGDEAGRHWLMNGHHLVVDQLRGLGHSMKAIPFPGVIYRVSHGENWTGAGWENGRSRRRSLQRFFLTRPFTPGLRREFGFHETSECSIGSMI